REHWSKRMCVLLVAHNGKDGEAAVNKIRSQLPKPIIDWCGPLPYTALQGMFDPFYPKGLQWYWKGDFVKELPDAAIDAHIAQIAKAPTALCLMHLYPIDGAVHKVAADATAWSTRDARWSMVIAAISPEPKQADDLKT